MPSTPHICSFSSGHSQIRQPLYNRVSSWQTCYSQSPVSRVTNAPCSITVLRKARLKQLVRLS